jgi:hypothetical protein
LSHPPTALRNKSYYNPHFNDEKTKDTMLSSVPKVTEAKKRLERRYGVESLELFASCQQPLFKSEPHWEMLLSAGQQEHQASSPFQVRSKGLRTALCKVVSAPDP